MSLICAAARSSASEVSICMMSTFLAMNRVVVIPAAVQIVLQMMLREVLLLLMALHFITDNTFDSNVTDRYAGALFGGPSSSVAVYRSTFTRNAVTYESPYDPDSKNDVTLVVSGSTTVRTANTIYTRSNGRVDDRCPANPRYCMGLLIHNSVFDGNIGGGSVIEAHNGDYTNQTPSESVVGNVYIHSSVFTNNDGRPVSKNGNSLLWIENSHFENHDRNIENNNMSSYVARIPIKPNGGCCTEPNRLDLNAMIWNSTIRDQTDCLKNYGTMMILSSTIEATSVDPVVGETNRICNLQRDPAKDADLYIEQSFLNNVQVESVHPHDMVILNTSIKNGEMIIDFGTITNTTFSGDHRFWNTSYAESIILKNVIAATEEFCLSINNVITQGKVYLLTTDSSCDGKISGVTKVSPNDLELQPAAFNGGQTPTFALGVNSAATQDGSSNCRSVGGTFTITIDQRGYDRMTASTYQQEQRTF